MAKVRQIALAFRVLTEQHQQMLRGITDYARGRGNWTITSSPETYLMSVTDLRGWPGHGVIADITTKREAAVARDLPVPVVNVSGVLRDAGVPRVTNDHRAIGSLAAEHLMSRGLWRFAYYGVKNVWYSTERLRGFAERLAEEGHQVAHWEAASSINTRGRGTWHDWLNELRLWLKGIEHPVGILAVHDNRARMLINVCGQLGLHVPHDVAVVGVNDDPTACEISRPTLTSIGRNGERIGHEAAVLLDRLMSHKKPPRQDILIPPGPLAQRESTDLLAVDDPDLGAAVRFIRERFGEGINVDGLLEYVSVSRRWLEHRFKQYFGCTPHEYLCETRVERTKELLTGPTRMTLVEIARACGFTSPRHLRSVFRRITGSTPREYRRSCRKAK